MKHTLLFVVVATLGCDTVCEVDAEVTVTAPGVSCGEELTDEQLQGAVTDLRTAPSLATIGPVVGLASEPRLVSASTTTARTVCWYAWRSRWPDEPCAMSRARFVERSQAVTTSLEPPVDTVLVCSMERTPPDLRGVVTADQCLASSAGQPLLDADQLPPRTACRYRVLRRHACTWDRSPGPLPFGP